MSSTASLYWWKPFCSPRDIAISTSKYGSAWARLALANKSISNFGDEVSRVFLQELTGESFRWSPASSADYLGVGSVLNAAIRSGFHGKVIGSGLRRPLPAGTAPHPMCDFIGVRGKLTANELGLPNSAAIGDPGLLARSVFPATPGERISSRPVLIPHFEVLNTKAGRNSLKALSNENWDVVLPNSSPSEVAQRIRRAPFVASSSLHGYIFAHALDTPTTLLEFRDESGEPDFKFFDYLSVFGLEPTRMNARDLAGSTVQSLIDRVEESTASVGAQIDTVVENMYQSTIGLRR